MKQCILPSVCGTPWVPLREKSHGERGECRSVNNRGLPGIHRVELRRTPPPPRRSNWATAVSTHHDGRQTSRSAGQGALGVHLRREPCHQHGGHPAIGGFPGRGHAADPSEEARHTIAECQVDQQEVHQGPLFHSHLRQQRPEESEQQRAEANRPGHHPGCVPEYQKEGVAEEGHLGVPQEVHGILGCARYTWKE